MTVDYEKKIHHVLINDFLFPLAKCLTYNITDDYVAHGALLSSLLSPPYRLVVKFALSFS